MSDGDGEVAADAGWVKASKHRIAVLDRLVESPAIPKEIKRDTDRPYSRVSDALDDLRERGLIELLVPEDQRKGRLHGVTERGKRVWEYLDNYDMVE